jgi:hypothetical protein
MHSATPGFTCGGCRAHRHVEDIAYRPTLAGIFRVSLIPSLSFFDDDLGEIIVTFLI